VIGAPAPRPIREVAAVLPIPDHDLPHGGRGTAHNCAGLGVLALKSPGKRDSLHGKQNSERGKRDGIGGKMDFQSGKTHPAKEHGRRNTRKTRNRLTRSRGERGAGNTSREEGRKRLGATFGVGRSSSGRSSSSSAYSCCRRSKKVFAESLAAAPRIASCGPFVAAYRFASIIDISRLRNGRLLGQIERISGSNNRHLGTREWLRPSRGRPATTRGRHPASRGWLHGIRAWHRVARGCDRAGRGRRWETARGVTPIANGPCPFADGLGLPAIGFKPSADGLKPSADGVKTTSGIRKLRPRRIP